MGLTAPLLPQDTCHHDNCFILRGYSLPRKCYCSAEGVLLASPVVWGLTSLDSGRSQWSLSSPRSSAELCSVCFVEDLFGRTLVSGLERAALDSLQQPTAEGLLGGREAARGSEVRTFLREGK